ncbi:SDR family NAD(P)-dependent oxidoreductase [Saccharothrix syringae]|uniref:SDR family NAD(P)-dependent oxidoreductase n=1 Tax=Saccharothrix syringae TaxID=103733 RepID=A0A5Q0GW88_SACSY|nr:SDR family NAD(P)-dependent oxidoreductase [Saccharothrix syringae]QFZ18201.1 SDR family NAD(P)-dependent oxidoreductase [Saccharothrix syringae]
MVSVLITGSADGIGRETAKTLAALGHRVVLHARNAERADQALAAVPAADGVLVGDLSSLARTRELGTTAGAFDVVVHNAALGAGLPRRSVTEDGLELLFQVNVLAPYLLTALMPRPARLVYLTSGLEAQGRVDFDDLQHERGPWNGMQTYSDSKLLDVVLAFAVARRWPDTLSNAVDPGWIKTKLGGAGAPDELPRGADTPVWLALAEDPAARVTGRYFKWRQDLRANPAAYDVAVQDRLLAVCAELTGVELP